MKLLVVDDEEDLCEILRFNLEAEGFAVDTAHSAEEAMKVLGPEHKLILLDVMLVHASGFDLARRLRREGNEVPVIFLTALSSEGDQLKGFDLGADDYITKPFSFPTVLARIQAVLKRSYPNEEEPQSLSFGGLALDLAGAHALLDDQPLPLTRKEFDILALLLGHPGRYFTREDIISNVWSDDTFIGNRSVDVHIARLRKKLGTLGDRLSNRTGFGYYFDEK